MSPNTPLKIMLVEDHSPGDSLTHVVNAEADLEVAWDGGMA
jgi:hypothetical protein